MKFAVKRLIRDEKGQTPMILVLILLVVGGLIITPLLAYMSTGLIVGEVYERRMAELYAADAGVDDALWQLKQTEPDPAKVPDTPGQVETYELGSTVNDKDIEVAIQLIGGATGAGIYKVTSTATGDGGSATTIESYIQTNPLFWDHAITSTGDIELEPGSEVYGDVMGDVSGSGEVHGNITDPYDPNKWPFTEDFRSFYWPQVEGVELPYETCGGKDYLYVEDYPLFGPGYHDYDFANRNLYIQNSGGAGLTATLNGTVYIKGDDATLSIGAGGQEFYLDLNYQTIYVEGISHNLSTPNKNALYVPPGKVTFIGSGVIIAEGNIDFQPNMEAGSEDDFIFVLSLFGKINFQPNGTLYGSVAAREVEVGSGNILTHTDSPTDPETGEQVLDFPMEATECAVKILTWDISQQ